MSERLEQEGVALSEEVQTEIKSLVDTYLGGDSRTMQELSQMTGEVFALYQEKNLETQDEGFAGAIRNGIRRYPELKLRYPDLGK
ncbi:MAG: hypothetical protein A2945_01040 [Candidatus Liptonbacteria bacterium RIFCSPLOWO2_01_FULL_52_25]|uniref:Uncharacterized protein n=1 Tax=Candidatus Liptonbacteria bacterium RIFCSPLOWO2_01_FULL_52_25 TaxID=1798650 RepID=A0A1G2CDH0_9BACT|nr:MAG: hypothetical protein A2945_01040 [Candidatus Liptonbacteria bacterium RIFCSPLOWO2_01_FULL_52_25]